MRGKHDDLALVVGVTLVAVVLALIGLPLGPVRAVIGVPFVLVIPGYALVQAAFARHTLGRIETSLCSIALSVAVVALGGFALNWVPPGLQAATWAVALGSLTLAAVAVAYRRRGGETLTRLAFSSRMTWRQGMVVGLAGLIFLAACGVAYWGARTAPTPGFTQFWLLPVDATHIRLGIRNEEDVSVEYDVHLQADGQALRDWSAIPLASGATWETIITLPTSGGSTMTTEALLYRTRVKGYVYRRVALQR